MPFISIIIIAGPPQIIRHYILEIGGPCHRARGVTFIGTPGPPELPFLPASTLNLWADPSDLLLG